MSNERRNLETAILCLERVVHPNTGEGEIVAGIEAFRRKVKGMPVEEVCQQVFDRHHAVGTSLIQYETEWKHKIDAKQERIHTLIGENINLNRELSQALKEVAALKKQVSIKAVEAAVLQNIGLLRKGRPELAKVEPPKPDPKPEPPPEPAPNADKNDAVLKMFRIATVQFDDAAWTDITWNQLRQRVLFKLLDAGHPLEEVTKTLPCIVRGKKLGYKYDAERDVSIKTRSANENTRDLIRTARAFKVCFKTCGGWPGSPEIMATLEPAPQDAAGSRAPGRRSSR